MLQDGKSSGFTERTLQRTLHELGGTITKRSLFDCWYWSLNSATDEATKPDHQSGDVTPKSDDAFEGVIEEYPEIDLPELSAFPRLQSFLHPTLAQSIAALDLDRLEQIQRDTARQRRERTRRGEPPNSVDANRKSQSRSPPSP